MEAPLGTAVFDYHDGVPQWVRDESKGKSITVNPSVTAWLVGAVKGESEITNKMIYLVARDEDRITLAGTYDGSFGIIFSIIL